MMVKEDPTKIGEEEHEKEADQENNVAVDRPVDRTQQRRNEAQIFNRQQTLLTGLSTARGPDSDFFSDAFMFLFLWTPYRTQILFIE